MNISSDVKESELQIQNSTCAVEQTFIMNSWFIGVLFTVYTIIFVVGICGNCLVIYVIAAKKEMKSNTNMYILNLAVADVLMCLFSVPLTPLSTFMGKWIFGSAMCKIFPWSQGVSVYVSTMTLTAIAVNRYQTVLHPYTYRPSLKNAINLIICIDILAMCITAPYAYFMKLEVDENLEIEECVESWKKKPRMMFGLLTVLLQFYLPLITIIVCYSRIMYRLKERSTTGISRLRMLIAMVAIFGMCWFPINLINFVADVVNLECWRNYYFTFFMCHTIAMSSTCYNPILYGWLNTDFRTEFSKLIICCRTRTSNSSEERGEKTVLNAQSSDKPADKVTEV